MTNQAYDKRTLVQSYRVTDMVHEVYCHDPKIVAAANLRYYQWVFAKRTLALFYAPFQVARHGNPD